MHFITSKLDFSNPPLYFQSNQITTMEFPSPFFFHLIFITTDANCELSTVKRETRFGEKQLDNVF